MKRVKKVRSGYAKTSLRTTGRTRGMSGLFHSVSSAKSLRISAQTCAQLAPSVPGDGYRQVRHALGELLVPQAQLQARQAIEEMAHRQPHACDRQDADRRRGLKAHHAHRANGVLARIHFKAQLPAGIHGRLSGGLNAKPRLHRTSRQMGARRRGYDGSVTRILVSKEQK